MVVKRLVNIEFVEQLLTTNIYVDRIGQPQSAPLLLGYVPHVGTFLEGPTVPRMQEVQVESTNLFVAQPAPVSPSSDLSDLIPSGQVSEMAYPIKPYKLMGKKSSESKLD